MPIAEGARRKYRRIPNTILGLFSHTKKIGECRVWLGKVNADGYARKLLGKRQTFVHRTMYELCTGEAIPAGKIVMHSCDNPPCINIDHLSVGTDQDNTNDMMRKGRKNPAKGERNHKAKLTAKQVLEIRVFTGTYQEACAKYQIDNTTFYNIRNRKTWRHL